MQHLINLALTVLTAVCDATISASWLQHVRDNLGGMMRNAGVGDNTSHKSQVGFIATCLVNGHLKSLKLSNPSTDMNAERVKIAASVESYLGIAKGTMPIYTPASGKSLKAANITMKTPDKDARKALLAELEKSGVKI